MLVNGDFNVDYYKDKEKGDRLFPYRYLSNGAGLKSSYELLNTIPKRGTHADRYIDYVMLGKGSDAKFTSHSVMTGYDSDHRPLVVSGVLNVTSKK